MVFLGFQWQGPGIYEAPLKLQTLSYLQWLSSEISIQCFQSPGSSFSWALWSITHKCMVHGLYKNLREVYMQIWELSLSLFVTSLLSESLPLISHWTDILEFHYLTPQATLSACFLAAPRFMFLAVFQGKICINIDFITIAWVRVSLQGSSPLLELESQQTNI